MININPSYAGVLLLKIEEYETKNIPVEISEVTVEHLMPQSISDWWKTYLGGEEMANNIYNEYLNCIGNLTPVSQSYNSTMSNKPWPDKLSILKNVQFTITSEIANKSLDWNKANILERNELMANRALKAITSPLIRTRPFRTKSAEDYSPEIYTLSDISIPMNGSTLVSIRYGDNIIKCSKWKDLLVLICSELIKRDEHYFKIIVDDNIIHKATSKQNYPQKIR